MPPNTLLLLKSNSLAKKWISYNLATQFPFNFLKITTSILRHDHIFFPPEGKKINYAVDNGAGSQHRGLINPYFRTVVNPPASKWKRT